MQIVLTYSFLFFGAFKSTKFTNLILGLSTIHAYAYVSNLTMNITFEQSCRSGLRLAGSGSDQNAQIWTIESGAMLKSQQKNSLEKYLYGQSVFYLLRKYKCYFYLYSIWLQLGRDKRLKRPNVQKYQRNI